MKANAPVHFHFRRLYLAFHRKPLTSHHITRKLNRRQDRTARDA